MNVLPNYFRRYLFIKRLLEQTGDQIHLQEPWFEHFFSQQVPRGTAPVQTEGSSCSLIAQQESDLPSHYTMGV